MITGFTALCKIQSTAVTIAFSRAINQPMMNHKYEDDDDNKEEKDDADYLCDSE